MLPFLHSSCSPNHKTLVLDPKLCSQQFSLSEILTLNKPEAETSQTQRPPELSPSTQDAETVDVTYLP